MNRKGGGCTGSFLSEIKTLFHSQKFCACMGNIYVSGITQYSGRMHYQIPNLLFMLECGLIFAMLHVGGFSRRNT